MGGGGKAAHPPPETWEVAGRPDPSPPASERAGGEECCQAEPGQRHRSGLLEEQAACEHDAKRAGGGEPHPVEHAGKVGPLPGYRRSQSGQKKGRDREREEHHVVVGRPDTDRRTARNLHEDRIQRAQQDGRRGRPEEDVVEKKCSLTAHRLKQAFRPDPGSAHRKQCKCGAGDTSEERQNEQASRRVAGERVN